jgi:hypothetical protein
MSAFGRQRHPGWVRLIRDRDIENAASWLVSDFPPVQCLDALRQSMSLRRD